MIVTFWTAVDSGDEATMLKLKQIRLEGIGPEFRVGDTVNLDERGYVVRGVSHAFVDLRCRASSVRTLFVQLEETFDTNCEESLLLLNAARAEAGMPEYSTLEEARFQGETSSLAFRGV